MKIENWAVVSPVKSPYDSPELVGPSLNGQVFGHPRFPDGKWVTTSTICGINEENEVTTMSGSSYELGQVRESYEEMFPGAKGRLLSSLR